MESAILMTVRLVISQEVLALSQPALALASSVLLHGALAAAVWSYFPVSVDGIGRVPSHAPVQILQLVPDEQAVLFSPNPAIQWPAAELEDRGLANRKPAPQTLRVGGAPLEAQFEQVLPLPAASAWTGLHIASSTTDEAGISSLKKPPDATDLGLLPIPRIDIISVPDVILQNAAVPVVNQDAAASGSGAVTASQSSEMPASPATISTATSGAVLEPTPDPSLARIELPRDSRPAMSLLGESVAVQYPEITNQAAARVVSTIYLRMGLRKSWFLEYWTAQPDQRGGVTSLDAPWPYLMLRPKLEFSPGENVVLVRGILTAAGQLQGLSPLLPPHWSQKDRLFEALAQWKFRPASRNGQPVAVEVLLVIPRQPEE